MSEPVPSRNWIVQLGLTLLVLGAASGAAWWLMSTAPTAKRRPRERQATPVTVQAAVPATHELTITAHGTVVPARAVELRPQVRGRIVSIHPQLIPGAVLPKGAVLAQIERRDYELEVERLQAALVGAESALQLEQGNQDIAQREYELMGNLGKGGDPSLALRKPQLAAAKAAVRSAHAAVKTAQLQLARTAVVLPFDAVVRSTQVAPGMQVSESSVLAALAGVDDWWVEVELPASDLRWIRRHENTAGTLPQAQIVDEAAWEPGESRTGHVARIAAELQRDGRLARCYVTIADPLARTPTHAGAPRLLIDAWVRVKLSVGALNDATALDPAWVRDGGSVWVMTADDVLAVRPITAVFRDAGRVLVTKGLLAGDRIVTSDLAAAVPGMKLRVIGDDRAADAGPR